jgi:hypothetical protein
VLQTEAAARVEGVEGGRNEDEVGRQLVAAANDHQEDGGYLLKHQHEVYRQALPLQPSVDYQGDQRRENLVAEDAVPSDKERTRREPASEVDAQTAEVEIGQHVVTDFSLSDLRDVEEQQLQESLVKPEFFCVGDQVLESEELRSEAGYEGRPAEARREFGQMHHEIRSAVAAGSS